MSNTHLLQNAATRSAPPGGRRVGEAEVERRLKSSRNRSLAVCLAWESLLRLGFRRGPSTAISDGCANRGAMTHRRAVRTSGGARWTA